jgi:L-threonylcarbamoyladenylate synthase
LRAAEIVAADAAGIGRAVARLQAGELVAFPTETVYGVAARADDPRALARLRAAKRRPAEQPFVIMVANKEAVATLAHVSPRALALMERHWPGPLTLILPARGEAWGATVGVRVPDHAVALALLRAVGVPLATSSANRAGDPPPTEAAAVAAALGPELALVLDGGRSRLGKASTILDVASDPQRILREGGVSRAELAP